jgi:hypothetical protein
MSSYRVFSALRLSAIGLVSVALFGACGEDDPPVAPPLATGSTTTTTSTTTSSATGVGGAGGEGGTGGATSTSTAGTGGTGGLGGTGGTGGEAPGCSNGVKDGAETDVDCGGSPGAGGAGGNSPEICDRCDVDQICVASSDCISEICVAGVCVAATCVDLVKNGDESDVDCGGARCPDCQVGQDCDGPGDCASSSCTNQTCQPPTCFDGIANGTETDKDCGGANCQPCAVGKACALSVDCVEKVCTSSVCAAASCSDGVTNGNETDKDCGGSCLENCPAGQSCVGNADCDSALCSMTICQCPAGMTVVPTTGGGTYCIDSTEVTRAQYQTFWSANPVYAFPRCGWNTDYTPSAFFPPPAGTGQLPVTRIDWCDAAAYCKWKGEKRVCGAIGGTDNGFDDYDDPLASEWMNACSAQGNNVYPYGDVYSAQTCYGADHVTSGVQPVRSAAPPNAIIAFCEGGAPTLYQMSGNVAEWDNSCQENALDVTGASDVCRVRGGTHLSLAPALQCDAADQRTRAESGAANDDVGFRCCL